MNQRRWLAELTEQVPADRLARHSIAIPIGPAEAAPLQIEPRVFARGHLAAVAFRTAAGAPALRWWLFCLRLGGPRHAARPRLGVPIRALEKGLGSLMDRGDRVGRETLAPEIATGFAALPRARHALRARGRATSRRSSSPRAPGRVRTSG